MSAFSRYIGIDYSGAETPEASLKDLCVFCTVGESAANEVPPPPSPRKYWTRRGVAHWLAARLAEDVPTIFSATGRQLLNILRRFRARRFGMTEHEVFVFQMVIIAEDY